MNAIRLEEAAAAPDAVVTIPLEPAVSYMVQWMRLGVEVVGALVVMFGVLVAIWAFGKTISQGPHSSFQRVRRILAHYLVVGLEFQLASDILSTAIAPTWNEIGKLSAIAVIRTVLNYFLIREMRQEETNV